MEWSVNTAVQARLPLWRAMFGPANEWNPPSSLKVRKGIFRELECRLRKLLLHMACLYETVISTCLFRHWQAHRLLAICGWLNESKSTSYLLDLWKILSDASDYQSRMALLLCLMLCPWVRLRFLFLCAVDHHYRQWVMSMDTLEVLEVNPTFARGSAMMAVCMIWQWWLFLLACWWWCCTVMADLPCGQASRTALLFLSAWNSASLTLTTIS